MPPYQKRIGVMPRHGGRFLSTLEGHVINLSMLEYMGLDQDLPAFEI